MSTQELSNTLPSTEKLAKAHILDDILDVRSRVCNIMLIALSITVIPALISSLYRAVDIGWQVAMTFQILMALSILSITIMRHKIPYHYRAGVLLSFFIIIGIAGVMQFGMMSGSILFLILAGPIASLFFEGITGILLFCLAQFSVVMFGYFFVSGTISLNFDGNAYSVALSSWITLFFGTLASGGVLAVGIYVINRYLMKSLQSARFHAKELEQHQANLEQVISERTYALKQSNQELEHFAQIAAHDMKSPMFVINGHIQLLEMNSKDGLNDKAKSHLLEINSGILRLNNMINDLLQYSRVSSQTGEFKAVDMNATLEIVKKQLATEIAESSVIVDIQPLPTINADEVQLIRVFQNLISNCIRYKDVSRPLKINIRAKQQDLDWLFSVSDNGIGIAENQFKNIFEIYYKTENNLHPESSGIGLAACKKIINRHNGKIWLESEIGKGTTFFFTLANRKVKTLT